MTVHLMLSVRMWETLTDVFVILDTKGMESLV